MLPRLWPVGRRRGVRRGARVGRLNVRWWVCIPVGWRRVCCLLLGRRMGGLRDTIAYGACRIRRILRSLVGSILSVAMGRLNLLRGVVNVPTVRRHDCGLVWWALRIEELCIVTRLR